MKRVLCVWLPNWPIQRRLDDYPRRTALVLVEPTPRGGQRIACASAAAIHLGVQPGMSAADAAARWNQRLKWEEVDPLADREALESLARQLGRFSPLVGLESTPCPDSLLLDVSGLASLFGGEAALAQAVQQTLAAQRLRSRVAIADTIGMAWAAARFSSGNSPFLVPAGEPAWRLAQMPPQALRLSDETLAALDDFGLRTIGAVLALPRSSLVSRLGSEFLMRLDQALGARSEWLVPVASFPEFVVAWDFETPTDCSEVIDAVLQQLCRQLAAKLVQYGHKAGELQCRCHGDGSPPQEMEVGFFEPTARAEHFHELLRLKWERAPQASPIVGMRLEALRTSPQHAQQIELFPDPARARQHDLGQLLDRLSGRLGRRAVVRPSLRAEAQPELAWRETPLVDGGKSRRQRDATPLRREFQAWERPLFLFRPAERIDVTANEDGLPLGFRHGRRHHQVSQHFGPERIETGWWRRRGVRRDYFRVETERGERYWLFRSLRNGTWYLHGEFA